MTDFFALLEEPRRPWLDPDSLRAKFLALSLQVHPDHVPDPEKSAKITAAQRFAELNAAYNCLREPKERLAHLLSLELGTKPRDLQQMPDDLAETFLEVAQLCRETDEFLEEKDQAASPLLQVQLFEHGQGWLEKISGLQSKLTSRREALTDELKTLDTEWTKADAARGRILEQLEELYRLMSFFTRWSGQLQERLVRLAA